MRLDGKIGSGEVLEIGNVTRSADLGFSYTVDAKLVKQYGGRLPLQVSRLGAIIALDLCIGRGSAACSACLSQYGFVADMTQLGVGCPSVYSEGR